MTWIKFCQSRLFSTANTNAAESPSTKVWRRSYPLQFTILLLMNETQRRTYVIKTSLMMADMFRYFKQNSAGSCPFIFNRAESFSTRGLARG